MSSSRSIQQPINLLQKFLRLSLLQRMALIFLTIGVLLIALRFLVGLGITTNMNDGYPWGVWITYDVIVGTALGTGGFLMAILIYMFNQWQYHPLIRSAVLTSALGYTLAGISVIIDLGRWWNFYSLLLPWRMNHTSVLLEVALCIMGYTLVTWIELSPALIEKRGSYPWLQKWPLRSLLQFTQNYPKIWNQFLILVIAMGIMLPIMHQSSLGSMMVIAGHKIHPLWASSLQPILFITSVAFMGYSMVVLESFASHSFFNIPCECKLIQRMIPVIAMVAVIWIFLRFAGIYFEGKISYLLSSGIYSILFWLEIFMAVVGVYILITRRYSRTPKRIFSSALLLVITGALFRFNVYLFAYSAGQGYVYFPSVMETGITFGLISIEIFIYFFIVNRFAIIHGYKQPEM